MWTGSLHRLPLWLFRGLMCAAALLTFLLWIHWKIRKKQLGQNHPLCVCVCDCCVQLSVSALRRPQVPVGAEPRSRQSTWSYFLLEPPCRPVRVPEDLQQQQLPSSEEEHLQLIGCLVTPGNCLLLLLLLLLLLVPNMSAASY